MTLSRADFDAIALQCEHQRNLTFVDVARFTEAYRHTKEAGPTDWHFFDKGGRQMVRWVCQLAELIHPNTKGMYRRRPVVFVDGSRALEHGLINRAMQQWAVRYQALLTGDKLAQFESPEAAYQEFEEIHPYIDGNGRVGDLLWRLATKCTTGRWPTTMPPEYVKR